MADLQAALSEAVKLNRSISQFLKFSTYTDYDDLSGLDIDFTDGEQLLLWEELRRITNQLADVQEYISYLTRPIVEVSRLRKGTAGKYRTAKGEIANITDDFRKDILREVEDETSHVLMEYANAETSPFALLYEVNGDEKATRRVLYNCSVSKPGENATTSGKTPQTDTMSITSVPLDDGLVRARTKDNTVDQVFNDWFKSVWRPAAASGASVVQANSPQEV